MKFDISHSINRVDSAEKSSGSSLYVADLSFPDMYFAKTIRSAKARAIITEINYPTLPEAYHFVDYRDVPGENYVRMLQTDWPFFAEKSVNHIGEPIALVVGPDREIVNELCQEVKINYEEKPGLFDIDQALFDITDPLYGEDNIFADYRISKGSYNQAEKQSVKVITGTYETGAQEHIYLEPQGMIAYLENNRVVVIGSIQCPYYVKNAVVGGLGCNEEDVRIIQSVTGGAFGGKEEYPSLIAGHAAFAAKKTGHPVKLIFDRDEDIKVTTKRHPSRIKLSAAIDSNHKVNGIYADIILEGGAYAGLSAVVLQRAMFATAGVYCFPNMEVRGRAVATNHVPFGAYRGFGAPQALYAIEMHMQHIAQELEIDPLEFKSSHFIKQGDLTVTSGRLRHPVKLGIIRDKLNSLKGDHSLFVKKNKLFGSGTSFFLHGCGFTGSGEQDVIKAIVRLKRSAENRVTILIANVEMGQGPQTTLRKVVANILDIPVEMIDYPNPDTDLVPDSGPTVASRTAMIVGGLLKKAAEDMKEKWADEGEIFTEARYRQPKDLVWDQALLQGDAYPDYAWGAIEVDVEIDEVTFEVAVKDIRAVFDVGKALDDKIIKGQIDGGIAQGIGWALVEKMEFRNGHILQDSITDYIIPSAGELPKVKSALVDNPYPEGPFGAKGAGELTFVGVAPAVAAAIENAIGKKIYHLPVIPEDLMEVLDD